MKKTIALLLTIFLLTTEAIAVPKLSSYPAAPATIFLDFDGHYVQSTVWNGGNSFYCAPSGLTDPQITEVFNRVAEDYRPFSINITTDSTVFLATPLTKRIRVVITTTSSWYPGVGGIAYVGSFTWGDDTPAFVFSDLLGPYSPKMVGECCSHESGHTLGLSHQSRYGADCINPVEPYNSGTGSGETGWSPIMGNSYYRNMSNWNNGPTPYGCTAVQDNLSIIATQNGFTYRADDYAEALNSNAYALTPSGSAVNGLISTNADKDAFKVTLAQNTNVHITAVPFNVGSNYIGANLDIKIELYNASAVLIRTYDPAATMSVTIDTMLNAGTYYLKLDGTGNTNTGEYGSLGSYTLNFTSGALPIHAVELSGTAEKGKHTLNWKIIADEPVRAIEVQASDDGIHFSNLTNTGGTANRFTYQPYKTGTIYYRLKVTSARDQTVYSNTIALRASGTADKLFRVSTLVQDEVLVNASQNYQYRLLNMNGSTLLTGSGLKGIARVSVAQLPGGMYMIQFFGNGEKQTERIIKQ